ncbi:hypothetical protein [Pseudomonas triclosanedens]|uniref:Uncharacterized protein n=1 Tax=Pseudomonas triclosanedens TaxID=2961893 RepID=A0ABY6ZYG1_9PSED|nr:hypothetical protein [Pseudomonas triclosanedens]WAI49035.1 hypothetical protein OU419_25350 [Pseudomonas triclosanedens]
MKRRRQLVVTKGRALLSAVLINIACDTLQAALWIAPESSE